MKKANAALQCIGNRGGHRLGVFIVSTSFASPSFLALLTAVENHSSFLPLSVSTSLSLSLSLSLCASLAPSSVSSCFEYLLCKFSQHATAYLNKKKLTLYGPFSWCCYCCCPITVELHSSYTHNSEVFVCKYIYEYICVSVYLFCYLSYKCEKIVTCLNKMQM